MSPAWLVLIPILMSVNKNAPGFRSKERHKIKVYMDANKLALNMPKTKIMLITKDEKKKRISSSECKAKLFQIAER